MTQLIVRDPFADFNSFNSLIENAFGRRGFGGVSPFSNSHRFELPVNVYETDEGVGIEAWLPGFEEDEIAVTVDDRTLTLRAAKRTEQTETSESDDGEAGAAVENSGERRYRRREVSHRVLSRSFHLGDDYDPDSIAAHLKNGILEVTIAHAPQIQPTQIPISAS